MAKRRLSTQDIFTRASTTALQLHDQDENVAAQAEVERVLRTVLTLEQIEDRLTDTRSLRENHVRQLAESIGVLGLIEPLVVDNRGRLLAGGHRKAALAWLKEREPEKYAVHFPDGLVPVRMMSFNADEDPARALEVEISENEKRRDYTPTEVRALAERLRQAGYSETAGRPKKGEKRLRPALEVIVGKSLRSVRRYLTEEKPVQVGQVSETAFLKQARKALEKWEQNATKESVASQRLAEVLPDVLVLIDTVIEER